MKRVVSLLIACVVLAAFMTACSSHTHTEAADWVADASNHWKLCSDCGEKTQSGEHTLDADGICGVCNSDIDVEGEVVFVYTCDENDNLIRIAQYVPDGSLLSETLIEYEFDANGCPVHQQQSINGQLYDEVEYTVVDGESLPARYTLYSEDGTRLVREYDNYGNEITAIEYDAEGNVNWHDSSVYARTADGEWYLESYTQVNSDGHKNVVAYTQYGDTTSDIIYDGEGNVLSDYENEYTYDENGMITSEKSYENGVIFSEIIYKVLTGEDGVYSYVETEVSYNEDGSRCACVYSESGELISMTSYDADGNLIE